MSRFRHSFLHVNQVTFAGENKTNNEGAADSDVISYCHSPLPRFALCLVRNVSRLQLLLKCRFTLPRSH